MKTTTTTLRRQIGTVEILRERAYPDEYGCDISVRPGVYALFEESNRYFWEMLGRPTERLAGSIGLLKQDGHSALFFVKPPRDVYTGESSKLVRSKVLSREELDDLLADPLCEEGHEAQRLRFRLDITFAN